MERDEVVVCYEDGVDGCGVDVFVSLEFVDLFYFRDADGEDAVGDFFSFQFDSRCCLEEDVVQAVFEAQEGYVVGVELADGVLGEVSFDEEFAVLFVGQGLLRTGVPVTNAAAVMSFFLTLTTPL